MVTLTHITTVNPGVTYPAINTLSKHMKIEPLKHIQVTIGNITKYESDCRYNVLVGKLNEIIDRLNAEDQTKVVDTSEVGGEKQMRYMTKEESIKFWKDMKCYICGEPAVTYQIIGGQMICKEHAEEQRKARNT